MVLYQVTRTCVTFVSVPATRQQLGSTVASPTTRQSRFGNSVRSERSAGKHHERPPCVSIPGVFVFVGIELLFMV